ncbi:MAG: chromosomal replication initiator protein DnaA [Actinobacteria bacterium]|nr:chromosomal replication initiator protein DnaA [Actinomycetota bacterium]MCB9411538.1 chromosomal replication initiator protein DnaA [Actinomycetota bacterium]
MTQGAAQLSAVWEAALSHLAADPDITAQQRAFVALTTPVRVLDDLVILAAPNEFTRDVLTSRLEPHVARALGSALGHDVQLAITVDAEAAPMFDEDAVDAMADSTYANTTAATNGAEPANQRDAASPLAHRARGAGQEKADESSHSLNPKYIFETFVIGSSNRFAHAAAVAVAEQPARAYNPLFIYGDSGLGKTHLLHAIGHYNRSLYSGARVRYISSEEFTNDFINSIRDDRNDAFQTRYRNVDVLLVDDIQFLSGKVQTQEEFFHTFNTLHNANKQIVVTSDLPPKKLPDFEERMRSRFEWGLITDVQPPDLETRIAILRKKKQQEGFEVPEESLEYIASRITSNIRELEGALIRVKAYASLNQLQADLPVTREVLDGLLPAGDSGPEITPAMIMEHTADYFGISVDDLTGASRSRTLVNARQIAMYLCRELTQLSLPRIGQTFGGRDHTTVMHADRKIRSQMIERRALFNQVSELTSRIKSDSRP